MKIQVHTMSAIDLIAKTQCGKINPDPIAQRPPVSQGTSKSEQIVKSLLDGFGIGMITLRDIRNDVDMQKVYPGTEYLVIDGGHRVRALTKFFEGKFSIPSADGKTKLNFRLMQDLDLSEFQIPYMAVECNSIEATMMFRNINTVTPVNFIEMVMSNEVSEVCKQVRSRTTHYKEYNNDISALFETFLDKHGKTNPKHWDNMAPNHRRKWDEFVFIAMIKAIGGGNVDAGQTEIEELAENGTVSKTALEVVDRFLQDCYEVKEKRGKNFTGDIFSALQLFWFGLYEQNKKFKITKYRDFQESFMRAYTKLSGKTVKNEFDTKLIEFDGKTQTVKEFFRANIKNYSNSKVQQECFKLLMQNMPEKPENFGVIFRESKRSLTTAEREEQLALQNYVCAIDGLSLSLEDSVWGHDTAWAEGGQLMDGAVIRKSHNNKMGGIPLDQYREILTKLEQV